MLTLKLSYARDCHVLHDGERICELPLQDGENALEIVSDYRGDFFLVEVQNGRKKGVHKVTDKPIDLSEYLFAGKLQITVSLVACCKVARKWAVVPLLLTDLAEGVIAIDEIEDLKARVAALEEKTKITM